MNNDSTEIKQGPTAIHYAAYVIVWIGFIALSFWAILVQGRELILKAFFLSVDPWQFRAIDMWGTVLLGLVWLVIILVAESYLRTALNKGSFWSRAVRIYLISLFIGLAALGLKQFT